MSLEQIYFNEFYMFHIKIFAINVNRKRIELFKIATNLVHNKSYGYFLINVIRLNYLTLKRIVEFFFTEENRRIP